MSTTPAPKPLTPEESKRWKQIKFMLEEHKQSFFQTVSIFREAKERRLYREEFKTFDDFCRETLGITKQRAHQLLNAVSATEGLTNDLSTMVDTERAARELAKVPPEQREKVIKRASKKGGKATGKAIAQAAKELNEKPPVEIIMDSIGNPIPKGIVDDFMRVREEIPGIMRAVSALKSACREHVEDQAWSGVDHQDLEVALSNAFRILKAGVPYAICPRCNGLPKKQASGGCGTCKDRGWVSKFFWKTCVPEETKAISRKNGGK